MSMSLRDVRDANGRAVQVNALAADGDAKVPIAEMASGTAEAGRGGACVVGGAYAFILRISSIAGLAPLRFRPTATGWTVAISMPMCVYSYALLTLLVSMAVWGVAAELQAGTERAVRMTSRMSQMVSTVDVLVVVLTAGVGICGAPGRMRRMIKFMDMLAVVDSSLGVEYSMWTERRSCGMVVGLIFSLTVLLVDDFCLYANQAKKIERHWEVVCNYIGFYLLYYVVVILELQFAFTASAVRKRFRALNDAIAHTARAVAPSGHSDRRVTRGPLNMFAVRVLPAHGTVRSGVLLDSLALYRETGHLTKNGTGAAEAVRRLAALHGSLCATLRHINKGYGLPLLIILISTLLHLIVTPYFLVLEIISSAHRVHFLVLQFLWCAAHLLRLFVIVEPCHLTMNEGRRTEELVCRLLGAAAPGAILQRLEIFARQLLLRGVSFTAFGVCTLDRPLVATVVGAVSTYLVILIQFQKSEM